MNYSRKDYQKVPALIGHPHTVTGVADGGAHVGVLLDASNCTFLLSHWAHGRTRGPMVPIEVAVKSQTRDTARLFGLVDRGTLEPGMKADLNVVDLEGLIIHRPELADDLPTGARRWVQRVSGYKLTLCSGVVTFEDGRPTGALPGRLVRNPATAAKRASGSFFKADGAKMRLSREAGRGTFDAKKRQPIMDTGTGGGASAMARSFNEADRQSKSKL